MAARLTSYSEQEKAVLQECRRKSTVGGLKWGLSSLLPLWAGFRAGFLPRFAAPPLYVTSFVLFSFLGAMSHNDSCIESILALEGSELAAKLRKSLPRQAKRYDEKRARSVSSSGRVVNPSEAGQGPGTERVAEVSRAQQKRGENEGGRGSSERSRGDGEWMERQDRRAVRRNKYGDEIFEDNIK